MSYLINQVTDETLKQNITAQQIFNGATYEFDGVDDRLDMANANPINSDRLTVIVDVEPNVNKTSGTAYVFGGVGTGAFTNRRYLQYNFSTKKYLAQFGDSAATLAETSVSQGKVSLAVVFDGPGGNVFIYINGALAGASSHSANYSVLTVPITAGDFAQLTGSSFFRGWISQARIYNRTLSEAEIKQATAGQYFGFIDTGATGVALTSGNLVTGKRYEIIEFATGDDFTNVGAASNATGQIFIASGTTPTTWTNSSKVVQRGLTLDLPQHTKVPGTWYDISGSNGHVTVTGAALNNLPGLALGPILNLQNIPTSASGLAVGRVWNDAGVLKIVTA